MTKKTSDDSVMEYAAQEIAAGNSTFSGKYDGEITLISASPGARGAIENMIGNAGVLCGPAQQAALACGVGLATGNAAIAGTMAMLGAFSGALGGRGNSGGGRRH